jgi:hypothetical protein
MFFGDSHGGLFATYVLLTEPTAFRRYGIGSPALGWNQEVMFEHEAEYARSHDDLPAKAFFSVGAHENPAGDARFLAQLPADRRARMEAEAGAYPTEDFVAHAERMVAALRGRAYPSLEVEYEGSAGRIPRDRATAEPLAFPAIPVRRASLKARVEPPGPG